MALDDDDQDVIRRIFRDEAGKLGKGPKDPEVAHLTNDRDKLKLTKEIHDLEHQVHPPVNWKRRGIALLVVGILALFAAPGFFPDVAIFHSSPDGTGTPLDEVGGVVLIGGFVWFFILRPMLKGGGSESRPAAKTSSGH